MVTNTKSRFSEVYTTVLRQHAEIRARIYALDADTSHVASPLSDIYLRLSLGRLAALFESHLAFEERELAPRIRDLDAWGPVREGLMLAEHVEQRKMMQGICALAEGESPALAVARAASRLVVSLLEDMAREEHELAQLERIDAFGCDQMTG